MRFYKRNDVYTDEEKLDESKEIYKFMGFDRLVEMLKYNKMYLRNVIKWDDTWEYPARYFARNEDELNNLQVDIYGSCWCTTEYTDALWRIYSQDKKSACIKTTVKKLKDAIKHQKHDSYFFLDKVVYVSDEEEAMELVKSISLMRLFGQHTVVDGIDITKILLSTIKRKAFEHEKEVRLLVQNASPTDKLEDGIFIDIDYSELISEVILDPRVDERYISEKKSILANDYNIKCRRSDLYDTTRRFKLK
ncbi:MAG: DUF2971 domain-containing protein [Defluviitaleaceae bacterium]|nr:DUF2971 domain-containing protein [Defluviitaleaceae bacterium]